MVDKPQNVFNSRGLARLLFKMVEVELLIHVPLLEDIQKTKSCKGSLSNDQDSE